MLVHNKHGRQIKIEYNPGKTWNDFIVTSAVYLDTGGKASANDVHYALETYADRIEEDVMNKWIKENETKK